MSQNEINELLAKINSNSAFNNNNENINHDSVKKQSNIRSTSVMELNRSASAYPMRNTPIHSSLNTHLKTTQHRRYGTNTNIFSRSRTAVMFNYSSKRAPSVFSPIRKNGSSQKLLSDDVPVEYDGKLDK